jgi:hypothetical protein
MTYLQTQQCHLTAFKSLHKHKHTHTHTHTPCWISLKTLFKYYTSRSLCVRPSCSVPFVPLYVCVQVVVCLLCHFIKTLSQHWAIPVVFAPRCHFIREMRNVTACCYGVGHACTATRGCWAQTLWINRFKRVVPVSVHSGPTLTTVARSRRRTWSHSCRRKLIMEPELCSTEECFL